MDKEVFLYGCEDCGTVVCNKQDHDKACYANYCAGCKQGSFFKKIKIMVKTFDDQNETHVYAVEEKEEKKDKFKGMGPCGHFNCEGDHV